MEDGTPDHDRSCSAVRGNSSCLAEDSAILESCDTKVEVGSPMVEDCSLKSEDVYKHENNDAKTDGISFAMDVASPNSKMEVGSPNMEVTSPSMDLNSSCMEVVSPKMEEGSAKMEEVAVKMGEVSVKSEDISTKSKENIASEQGSSKMEEVAVKMGEVSVKSEKYSVQFKEGVVKVEGNAEIRVQVYHGSRCITEGEVPDWLTVDILARAIYNDRPGTKKPLIRPFGSDSKTRTNGPRQATGKSHPFSRENSFNRSVNNHSANRPSGNNSIPEPSSSQSLSKTVNSPSPGKPSTSQSANKPSTSQSSSSKQSTSQISNTPSSSTATERPSNTSVSNQNKGKSSGGRIKGKSSVSLYKGKAPASEAASRASVQLENKNTCIGSDSSSSVEIAEGRLVDKNSETKPLENDSTLNFVNPDSNISSETQGAQSSSEICGYSDNSMGDISRNIDDKATPTESLVQNSSSGIIEENPDESANSFCIDKSDNCDFNSKSDMSEMFKKPTDPPKRSVRKTNIPPKELLKQQEDPSKEPFKKPNDPPKRTMKIPSDILKEGAPKPVEPMKVLFKESDQSPEGVQKVADDSKILFSNPDEHLKSMLNSPTDQPSSEKPDVPLRKPKLPPLRVIRFIAQRLSSGNTVYRVRATAVRGSTARDYHLVVKLCSSSAEITYYKKVAPRVPYVPRVLLCHNNIVVMDDLIHEGFKRPKGTLTPAQMTVAIDGLARMHTASVMALKRDPSLLEAFPQASKATESDIARDLHVLADRVKSWSLPDSDYYAARCHALAECVPYLKERLEPADTNMTVLLHGNVSPRNVFFLYDSRNPRLPAMASFVDFANVYWGHPALDISLVTGPAGGFWEGYKIVLMSLLTRASGRMWLPQPEVKDCGETYAFALLRAVCSSVSGPAAKVLEAKLIELFPVFRQYSWLDFW